MKCTKKGEPTILQTQIEIQEQTLKNISQEIHDNIGQVLSLAKLNINTFAVNPDEATQIRVEDTKQLISKALRDLRDLSRSMHGDKIAELGLQQAIADELKLLQNTGKFLTNIVIAGSPYKMEQQNEMVIFRMLQEALNNAIKHSKAKNIEVNLQYDSEAFQLTIRDDGIGFDPSALQSAETGIGLKSMQNRAALIGAEFRLDSNTEQGTSIHIELKNPV
ncbi:MAG: sensor histidine kinase [Ferruginibacter sp.]